MTVTVSVIMPVYDAERFLAEAVESVLQQTYTDFELVAINDGSNDGSLDMLKTYADRDPRVKIISRPNTGIVGALNDGLAAATGEFVARMDADDVALPDRFARQVDYLRADPEVVAVGCGCLLTDVDGDPFHVWGRLETHEEIEAKLLCGIASAIVHASIMTRRKSLQAIGGYRDDVGVSEDLDLFLRLAEIGRLANIPEVLMMVRRYDDSLSGQLSTSHRTTSRNKILAEARRRRGLPEAWQDVTGDTNDPVQLKRRRAMQAWRSGYQRTARKYAWQVFRQAPTRRPTWSLLKTVYCGRPQNPVVGARTA